MQPLLVITTSLNPNSRSATMAATAKDHLLTTGRSVDWLDLRQTPLPACDASTCYGNAAVIDAAARIERAAGIIIAAPVYNYDLGATAKNLVELTGQAWNNTIIGLILAAGGQGSYMSGMPFLNSLMLDFRCTVVPRFVYATKSAFEQDGQLTDTEITCRIKELSDSVANYADKLNSNGKLHS